MKGKTVVFAALVALSLIAASCGGGAKETSGGKTEPGLKTEGGGETVDAELKEMTITASPSSIAAGSVTFAATNVGTIDHELVVLKTDLAPDALPVKDGKVEEAGTGIQAIGEIEEFAPGKTESATFNLEAGKYVLLCNIASHYQAGMRAAFTVS